MAREQWRIDLVEVDVDEAGNGRAVYNIKTPSRLFSFVVQSRQSSDEENTDRIIAESWDLETFLCEGRATPEFIDSQFEELPKVRKGRATPKVLIWSRANRSSRFFDHIVDSLASGHQPDVEFLSEGGYLTRSSGYYGNGLNGTKVFAAMDDDHPLKRPFMAQMLAVYMLRVFGYDLADEMAKARNPDAATLSDDIKRYLGTGNSSGVGIILYMINHPQFVHSWLRAREVALARAKARDPTDDDIETFTRLVEHTETWFAEDESDTERFFHSKDRIAHGLEQALEQVDALYGDSGSDTLWTQLCEWAKTNLEAETQEVLHALLIDVYPEVCDGLEDSLTTAETSDVKPEMSLAELESLITSSYQWALDIDMTQSGAQHYVWYRSVENEEPRIGVREEHDYEEYEIDAAIARQVQQLYADLQQAPAADSVAEFLFEYPEHREIAERIQTVHNLPYAEVRANPIDEEFVPLTFISCLKAIWGIQKAHPKSIGWVRGTFFQGAPLREELPDGETSYWAYPSRPDRADYWRDD
ncbi:hypothetical protein [Haloarcula nitratireducens]|uniref:DUF3800 domain-containing protein n=1 Tax=Haloarcula nitratireducens TaxID=2487749 RepID=A0AAW4PGZ3_9EURY|nr:hypothetical protein [Halomicroarcula nitratireducens]MBX0297089.1 hypothetical protein [Halomicroarcula nitratireducens]